MNKRAYYDKRNKRRSLVIKLIIELTGDSKLGNQLRDKGNKYLINRFPQLELVNGVLRIKKKKKTAKKEERDFDDIEPNLEEREDGKYELNIIPQKKETYNQKRRRLYKEAREAGYTPEEARNLRGKAQENFNNVIQFNKVIDNQDRYSRWAKWGKRVAEIQKKIDEADRVNKPAHIIYDLEVKKRNIYPKWIQDLVEEINEEAGYDVNASYGWNAIYMYYTEGGTVDFWKSFFMADPLNPNIYKAKAKLVVSVSNRGRRRK